MGEFWLQLSPDLDRIENLAREAEQSGWDGIQIADGRSGDVFVALALASRATTRIGLATGVVNFVVRHPAVLASAIAGVGKLAPGRVVLGVGRGDSSVRTLGLSASPLAEFERDLIRLQAFLRGEVRDGAKVPWLVGSDAPKVPVDVAASGPLVISLAARLADRVTLAVGVDLERVRQAIDVVRRAPQPAPMVGLVVPIGVDDDPRTAALKARGPASVTTHFLSAGGITPDLSIAEGAAWVDGSYDYDRHGRSDSAQALHIDRDLLSSMAVWGSPAECRDQLRGLLGLAPDRVVLMTGLGADPVDSLPEVVKRIGHEVLAPLRAVASVWGPPAGGNRSRH